jgi:hypothetical protein
MGASDLQNLRTRDTLEEARLSVSRTYTRTNAIWTWNTN